MTMSEELSDIYQSHVLAEYAPGRVVSVGSRRVSVTGPGIHKGTWIGYELDSNGTPTTTRVDFRDTDIVNRDTPGLGSSVVEAGGGSACGAASTSGALKVNLLNESFDAVCDEMLVELSPWHKMSVRDKRKARREKMFPKKKEQVSIKPIEPREIEQDEVPRVGDAADQEAIEYRERMRAKEASVSPSVSLGDIFKKPIAPPEKSGAPSLGDIFNKIPDRKEPIVKRVPVSPKDYYKRMGKKLINKGMSELPKVVKDITSTLTPDQANTIKNVQPPITPEMDDAWKSALKKKREKDRPRSLSDFFNGPRK